MTGIDRAEMLRRFEVLLDSALTSEAPPAGIDAAILSSVMHGGAEAEDGGDGDSLALWSAMTALTQETKLQGRAFQELNLTLAAQVEKMTAELRAAYAERERAVQREAERRCRREMLGAFVDLRDRLGRGLESVQAREAEIEAAARRGWLAKVYSPSANQAHLEAVRAMIRGYELGLDRLDQTLDECDAREIRCEGEIFDPRRMNAVESEESAAVPAGTVLEVYRSGYEWNGEVFRPAQVKVSRGPVVGSGGL